MQRLACPLDPYPDEIFYSILARLKERLGCRSRMGFSKLCFGSETIAVNLELPSHLNYFGRVMRNPRLTAAQIIQNHTLLPYFAPFLPSATVERVRHDITSDNGPGAHMRFGVMASTIHSPIYLKLCIQCIEDDRDKFGECYWHRVHQLPGVFVCPIHHTYLATTRISARRGVQREYTSAEVGANELGMIDTQTPTETFQILLQIAKDSLELLDLHLIESPSDEIRKKYRYLLLQLNLCNSSGRTKSIANLVDGIKGFFGKDLLETLECSLDLEKVIWPSRVISPSRLSQHPLRHLLLMQFLGYSPKMLLAIEVPSSFFGDSPWPCLNPIAEHYLLPIIEEIDVIYMKSRPVGIFTCKCGFSYKRAGPDSPYEDRFRLDSVVSYGHVWEQRLRTLWEDKSMSLMRIAKELDVETVTIKHNAIGLGLSFPRQGPRLNLAPEGKNKAKWLAIVDRRTFHREAWIDIRRQNPEASMGILKQKHMAQKNYHWLSKYDSQWLSENKPPTKRYSNKGTPVDWEARDAIIAEMIPAAVQTLISNGAKPIRITVNSVGRSIGLQNVLNNRLNRLPKTAHTLSQLVETWEQYAIRRIAWAMRIFKEQGVTPTRTQIVKVAGIQDLKERPVVREAIDAVAKQGKIR